MAHALKDIGVIIPQVLLPREGIDPKRWAVVACDQFTSQPEYWQRVEQMVGTSPSTVRITFPEAYLELPGKEARIADIQKHMRQYLDEGILVAQQPGFVFVDRATNHAASRKGLIVALDLEHYDYSKGSSTLIRATEGTVVERLPPRIAIREGAPIELPHIMVLIDDPSRTVIEPIAARAAQGDLPNLYDFDLMLGSGHLKGYLVLEQALIDQATRALVKLADQASFCAKYNVDAAHKPLLFAMGDGNHSLATAKAIWERLKSSNPGQGIMSHPARYALVELVNVHDPGLVFEPIHRVLFGAQAEEVIEAVQAFAQAQGSKASVSLYDRIDDARTVIAACAKDKDTHQLLFCQKQTVGIISVTHPTSNLPVGTLQAFIDAYLMERKEVKVDYVHGDDVVETLAREGNMGFLLPAMDKNELFRTVILDGALPRKTFSMGEADEKRFYMECRRIL